MYPNRCMISFEQILEIPVQPPETLAVPVSQTINIENHFVSPVYQ